MRKALIIVDMQIMPFIWKNYGGKELYKEKELLDNTKILINKAKKAKAPVIYILYTEAANSPRGIEQPLWHIHPEIVPAEEDKLIIKYYADSFYETDLERYLRESEITDLVFCGVQTEYCIDTTVKRAFSLGFKNEIAADCHSTYDSDNLKAEKIIDHHNSILEQFTQVKTTAHIEFDTSH